MISTPLTPAPSKPSIKDDPGPVPSIPSNPSSPGRPALRPTIFPFVPRPPSPEIFSATPIRVSICTSPNRTLSIPSTPSAMVVSTYFTPQYDFDCCHVVLRDGRNVFPLAYCKSFACRIQRCLLPVSSNNENFCGGVPM